MQPSSYEQRILDAALRLERASHDDDANEMSRAVIDIIGAARSMRQRRATNREQRDESELLESRVEYDDDDDE